jgi:hypothetical protein
LSKKKHKHKNKALLPPSNSSNPDSLAKDNPVLPGTAKLIRTQAALFSGPIPPPDLLDRYNQMIPDGANRILKMAENQSTHRQFIEKWAIVGGTILSYIGVLCAAVIAIGALYIGSDLIKSGHVIPGSVLGGSHGVGPRQAFDFVNQV